MDDREKTREELLEEVRMLQRQLESSGAAAAVSEEEVSRLAAIVESSDDAIIGESLDGTILAWNPAAERTYGYPPEEAMGKSIHLIVPPERRRELNGILEKIKRGEKVGSLETIRLRKGGARIHVSLSVSPLRDKSGKIVGASAIGRDIAPRKRAEKALKESEETMRGLLNAPTDMALMLVMEKGGNILVLNETAARILGGEVDKLTGKCLYALLPSERSEARKEILESVFQTGKPARFEEDWEDRVLDTSAYPVLNPEGKVEKVAIFASDVTERKRAQEKIKEQKEFLQQLIESLTQPFYVVDVNDYSVKLANAAARRRDLSPPVTCYAMTYGFAEACHSSDHTCPLHIIRRTGKPATVEHIHTDDSGNRRYVEVHGYPVFSPNGELAQIIEYSFDITERKKMEESLRRAKEELESKVRERTEELELANDSLREYTQRLEQMNRELQDFTFLASHHLQEPLRKIQLFANLLRSKFGDTFVEEVSDRLKRMEVSADWMRSLLQVLLRYYKLANSNPSITSVDLTETAGQAAARRTELLDHLGGRVEIGNLPVIEADKDQMEMLFENLLDNALKFHGGEKPFIKIYADGCIDGHCRIYVEDKGIGFDEKFLDIIFRPLQQLHGRDVYEGKGIGLAICKKIVERHGGTLTARSAPGKGSTFTIRLPLSRGQSV